jgi:hypothetical protein
VRLKGLITSFAALCRVDDVVFDPQLIAQPGGHRLAEHAIGARKRLHVGEQEPFEFDERLLEEDHVIHIGGRDPAGLQAEVNRLLRELVVVFLPPEALLLGLRDQLAVAEQRRGRSVALAGNAKNIHQNCLLACAIGSPSRSSRSPQPRGVPGFIASGSLRQRTTMATGPRIKK